MSSRVQGNLQELAAQKEQEWREVQRLQTQAVEAALKEKEKLLKEATEKFSKLKDDFKYNLKLLMERDQELERYDAVIGKIKASLQSKDAEISDLKIQIDDLRKALKGDEETQAELQRHYHQKIREKNVELEHYKRIKDEETEKEREDVEAFRLNLQRQVRQLEDELDVQRRELSSGFDEAMKRREKEYRTKIEELSASALSYEMKAKFLSKEVDLVRSSAGKTNQELVNCNGIMRNLEKQLKEKEWELQDTIGTKDARISDLEQHIHENDLKLQRALEEFKRKHSELDRYAREKENALSMAKECHMERERHQEAEIRELRAHLEQKELEWRKNDWNHQDELKERDGNIENLKEEIAVAKSQSDAQMANVTQEMTKMKMEMQRIQENETKLLSQLNKRKEDIERYKKDVTQAVVHHAELERSKAQLEVDWQRRYEDAERNQYSRSEELIEKLTRARDEALALVTEREREMTQKDQLLRSIKTHRDNAMATLKKHNLKISPNEELITPVEDSDERTIRSLEEQNDALKSVIQRMREEMESLTPASHRPERENSKDGVYTAGYTKSMERDMKLLKAEKRELSDELENLKKSQRMETNEAQKQRQNQQDRNLSDQTRTHSQEIAVLKQQIANLEWKLGNSKMERSQNDMRSKDGFEERGAFPPSKGNPDTNTSVSALQAKLKTAIHHISRLVKERQQLIELSNRLRSEVARSKTTHHRVDGSHKGNEKDDIGTKPVSPREMVQKLDRQLNAVEQLQYSLTTKELKMMQKGLTKDQERSEVIQVQLSSSSSSTPSSPPHDVSPSDTPSQDPPGPPANTQGKQQYSDISVKIQEASSLTNSSSNELSNQGQPSLMMMSSVGEDSMKDIWKLLELPPSPSPVPFYEVPEAGHAVSFQTTSSLENERSEIEVIGSRTQISSKPTNQQRQVHLSAAAAGKIRQQPVKQKKSQIRNYNQRDEIT
ncbi:coiled-coil domain-containing protein 57-like isoform X2 [Apostichopus japonicus]|uniref:coiled-coil domain-containing protein 57-like isoform X2 n=1 Tax=Stichopus japonicus TaxID=307972 RepID=UPI003AB7F85B